MYQLQLIFGAKSFEEDFVLAVLVETNCSFKMVHIYQNRGKHNSCVYNVRLGVVDLNLRYVQFLSPSLPTCSHYSTILSTACFDGQLCISQSVCVFGALLQ